MRHWYLFAFAVLLASPAFADNDKAKGGPPAETPSGTKPADPGERPAIPGDKDKDIPGADETPGGNLIDRGDSDGPKTGDAQGEKKPERRPRKKHRGPPPEMGDREGGDKDGGQDKERPRRRHRKGPPPEAAGEGGAHDNPGWGDGAGGGREHPKHERPNDIGEQHGGQGSGGGAGQGGGSGQGQGRRRAPRGKH